MVYAPDAGRTRGLGARVWKSNLVPDAGGWTEPEPQARDIKKIILVAGLGILSWVATYVGMLELIEANMGVLPLVHKVIIAFSVAMLMTMIIWLLDQMFAPIGAFTRLCYLAGYVFLTIISVGFGFGFYWKVLESRSEASRSAESAVTAVQGSLHAASTRLEQLDATLVQLAALSREKAEIERTKGTSCPNSKPGDGPRRKMRDDDAARFTFASDFVKGRVGAVKTEMSGLDTDLAKITTGDASTIDPKTGTRNEFMKALGRKLDMTVTGFNAVRTDPQLKQLRTDLAERADRTTFGDPKNGGFACPDPQLAQALRGAVRAIDQLPELEKPEIAAVEGSEATIEAFRRLTTTFYGLLAFKLPPSADELRELQKKAIQSVEGGQPHIASEAGGLSKRDYVPLAVAIFVDLCLLLVSMGRPVNRLHGLVPKMRDAERGPVIEILSRFNDIHRDNQIRENFELFRHVVFDVHGAYYVAVPLDAPPRMNPREREELRLEAQLLANLFTSFEKDQIFKRTWSPLAGTIRRKLRKQGSKFAESEAFRVYRFRDGAWPEIILGAVMGAARRVEAEQARRRIEEGFSARSMEAPFATDSDVPLPFPYEETGRPTEAKRTAPLEAVSPSGPHWSAEQSKPKPFAPRAYAHAPRPDPRYGAGFGAYAKSAQKELSNDPDFAEEDMPVKAANSNTGPAPRRTAEMPHAPIAPVRTEPEPGTKRTSRTGDTVDVVLKRETATLTLPAESSVHDGIISRLGEALQSIEAERQAEVTFVPGTRKSVPLLAADEAAPDVPQYEIDGEMGDLTSDPETDDAAGMAGRLRPATAAS